MRLTDYIAGQQLGTDMRAWVLAMAAQPVTIINARGRRETVTAFEARLIELGSPRCRRRLHCQDFIWLVMTAASMPASAFNANFEQILQSRNTAVSR